VKDHPERKEAEDDQAWKRSARHFVLVNFVTQF